jgi:hypothetical protein
MTDSAATEKRTLSIEEIIEQENSRFLDLRKAKLIEYYEKQLENENIDSKMPRRVLNALKGEGDEDYLGYQDNILCNDEYFMRQVVPKIKRLTDDPEEFSRISQTWLKAVDAMTYMKDGSRVDEYRADSLVEKFTDSYLGLGSFLHKFSEELITMFAYLQSSKEDIAYQGIEYFFSSKLEPYAKLVEEGWMSRYREQVIELGMNFDINNGSKTRSDKIFEKLPKVLKEIEEETSEDFARFYLEFATILEKKKLIKDSWDDHNPLDYFKIENIKLLFVLEEFSRDKTKFMDMILSEAETDFQDFFSIALRLGRIKENYNKTKEKYGEDITSGLADVAVHLAKKGVRTSYLFSGFELSKMSPGRINNVLRYVNDLADFSSETAETYAYQNSHIDELNTRDRERILETTMYLAKRFGNYAGEYLSSAVMILEKTPDKFDSFVQKLIEIGNYSPQVMKELSIFSYRLLSDNIFDKVINARMYIEGRVRKIKDKNPEHYEHLMKTQNHVSEFEFGGIGSSSMSVFYNFIFPMGGKVEGITLEQFTEDFMEAFEGGDLDAFSTWKDALKAGITYDNFIKNYRLVSNFNLFEKVSEKKYHNVRTLFESEMGEKEKIDTLREYQLASKVLGYDNMPELDIKGEWKVRTNEIINKQIKEVIDVDISHLSIEDLFWVANITKNNRGRNIGEKEKARLEAIITTTSQGTIKKNYPLGKAYGSINIEGLEGEEDPIMLTEQLVYALISRNKNKRENAEKHFDRTKLQEARNSIRNVGLFELIKDDLKELKKGSGTAAQNVLSTIYNQYGEVEAISDMIIELQSMFGDEYENFNSLTAKVQTGIVQDLFDNTRTMCCAFFPSGINRNKSFDYLLDENVGLIHLVPEHKGIYLEPISVAITIRTISPETGERYLLIDSVEGGKEIDRISDCVWMAYMHSSIMSLAKDIEADGVIYNSGKSMNSKPRNFVRFLESKYSPSRFSGYLAKEQEKESVRDQFTDTEAVKRYHAIIDELNPSSEFTNAQNVERIDRLTLEREAKEILSKIANNYGVYNESGLRTIDSLSQTKGQYNHNFVAGNVKGLLFEVAK